jgi:putative MATE family efflux protein
MTTPSSPASVPRRLLSLALPVVGLNVLNVLSLAVDTAMVGRLPDPASALTGLGYGTQFLFILMVLMIGLAVGSVAIVARAFGARDLDRVNHQLGQSMMLTVGMGVLMGLVGRAVAPLYLDLVSAQGPARAAALEYLDPLLFGLVFNYLTILLGSMLRGVGNTRLAFQVALVSNLANFGLNSVLIYGALGLPGLGVRGAAIGTLLSQVLSLLLILGALARGAVPGVRPPLRPVAVDWAAARSLWQIGAPAALDMVVLNAGFLSIVTLLGLLDPLAVAAHGIGLRIQALAFVPGMAISQATGALVGNALGAGKPDEARQIARASVGLCVAVMSVIPLFIALPSDAVLALFDVDPAGAMGGYATTWIRILGLCMPLAGVHVALAGAFQGAGATPLSLRLNLASTLLVQIPASYLLGVQAGLGPLGVWLGFPLGFVARSGLAVWTYADGAWLRARVR